MINIEGITKTNFWLGTEIIHIYIFQIIKICSKNELLDDLQDELIPKSEPIDEDFTKTEEFEEGFVVQETFEVENDSVEKEILEKEENETFSASNVRNCL